MPLPAPDGSGQRRVGPEASRPEHAVQLGRQRRADLVQLPHLAAQTGPNFSGGNNSAVAVARALVPTREVLHRRTRRAPSTSSCAVRCRSSQRIPDRGGPDLHPCHLTTRRRPWVDTVARDEPRPDRGKWARWRRWHDSPENGVRHQLLASPTSGTGGSSTPTATVSVAEVQGQGDPEARVLGPPGEVDVRVRRRYASGEQPEGIGTTSRGVVRMCPSSASRPRHLVEVPSGASLVGPT